MKHVEILRWILPLLIVLGAILSVVAVLLLGQGWGAALLNLGAVLIGSALTCSLIGLLIERMENQETERRALQEEKAYLIRRMGSDVRDVAVPAVDELRRRGWLIDGSLRRAVLNGANLEGAHLMDARLEEADLQNARLERANLADARLGGANLARANLSHCVLGETNLCKACLWRADLSRAVLACTYLKGASIRYANLEEPRRLVSVNLSNANLEGARTTASQLERAISLSGATLPDGTELSEDNWRAEFEEWRSRQKE